MATYKLIKKIANAQSFRFDGIKYVTREVTQNQLERLFGNECPFVVEAKEPKSAKPKSTPKPSKKKSNVEEKETGSATE